MPLRLNAEDDVLAAGFSQLVNFNSVARLLEVKPRTLGFYLTKKNNYKAFGLKTRLGGERVVAMPVTPLKIIQRKLNQVLHAVYKTRSPVHGYVRGKGIVTNAQRHLRKAWVLNLDLEDFFPTIHFGRVKGMFQGKPYLLPERAALTLAQICCFRGALPIGAPTSPTVSNMICAQMDSQLKRLAVQLGCTYTRYADDITISVSHGRIPAGIVYQDPKPNRWTVGTELSGIIAASGFKINASKTRVRSRGYRQEVTGLVVGERANVKRHYIRQVRAMLHASEKWGIERAQEHFRSKYDRKQRLRQADFLRVLRGKI